MFKKCLIISIMVHILLIVGAGLSLSRPPALIKPAYFQLVRVSATASGPAGIGLKYGENQKLDLVSKITPGDRHRVAVASGMPSPSLKSKRLQPSDLKPEVTQKAQNLESTTYLSQVRNGEQSSLSAGGVTNAVNESSGNPEGNINIAGGKVVLGGEGGNGGIQGNNVTGPLKSYTLKPYYPQTAKEKGWQGTVILEAALDKKGRVGEISKIQSSGFSLLDEEAIKAVKKWRYQPATQDGKPIEWRVRVKYVFKLEE
jgi:periplasmic protein TonB